jgi:antitoxin component of MazEF toxin-antitoxin module
VIVKLVAKGDSAGIEIPHAMLRQIGAAGSVELSVEDGRLVIRAAKPSRQQWEDALASLIDWVDRADSLGEVPDLPRHRR